MQPTRVPGSWLNGTSACGNAECSALAAKARRAPDATTRSEIWRSECGKCQDERASRCRVLRGADDPRLRAEKSRNAPAIFPNNDIKYEVNRRRAMEFAARTGQAITWVPARDKPSAAVLNEKPNIATEKLGWLNRHDKDCGALYGMLPLVTVTLEDHLDRNPEKQLLKGRVGYVEGLGAARG